jgi:hypothetical protein
MPPTREATTDAGGERLRIASGCSQIEDDEHASADRSVGISEPARSPLHPATRSGSIVPR